MKKTPTSETETFYDFMEMTEMVDGYLGYPQRKAHRHFVENYDTKWPEFDKWHKSKGYPDTDPEGKGKGSSQIWYAEYSAHLKELGNGKKPYMDFWQWQHKWACGDDFQNDTYSTVWVGSFKDMGEGDYYYDNSEPWQREIQEVYHKMFSHLCKEHSDTLPIKVSW